MIADNLVVNGLIKVTSQAEVNTLTVDQVNDTSGEDIAQLQGATSNVQEQINALATSYDESIDNSTEFKTGVANAVNSLSDEPNLNSESTLEQYVTAISLLGGKNYKGRLTASDDLDNVSDDGFYDIVSTDQPVHIPSDCGGMNACVEVFNLPEIETIYQRYHKFQGGVFTYSRRKFNGAWSDWVAYTFGVKGNAETSYRSGNVNLTPENIGATPNYSYTIDLSDTYTYLESNWYPVVGTAIPATGMHHIKLHVQLNSGTKPSWSTHGGGFSCNMDLRVKASGWGTTNNQSICLEYDCLWCQDNINPCGYMQLTTASFPVLWLRGGGKYFVEMDYKCEWSPKSSTYTVNNESISPVTNCPGIQFNRSTVYANIDGSVNGNASSATKWGSYTNDFATLNSTDTWLLVVNNDKVQHRLATDFASANHAHDYIPTSASCNKNWWWSGQGGQPNWIWGGNDGTNMYVYSPSNFSVNYANSAGNADTLDGNHASAFATASHSHNGIGVLGYVTQFRFDNYSSVYTYYTGCHVGTDVGNQDSLSRYIGRCYLVFLVGGSSSSSNYGGQDCSGLYIVWLNTYKSNDTAYHRQYATNLGTSGSVRWSFPATTDNDELVIKLNSGSYQQGKIWVLY